MPHAGWAGPPTGSFAAPPPTARACFDDRVSEPRVPLSILDLVPVSAGMSRGEAIEESLRLARRADELGFARYWVAEHHNTDTFLSSATSLVLAHLAEHTSRIRLGSGGVMLPNHAPLMVAEYYGTLATIYGDRFDLGLGRAPGTDPRTAAALRRGGAELDTFADDVLALMAYLGEPDAGADRAPVRAIPGEGTRIPLWMLGSSTGGAQVAAALGLPFAFASHFAPRELGAALSVYRGRFADGARLQCERPYAMAGVNVLVADSQREAERLFTTTQLLRVRIRTGSVAPLDPPEDDLAAVLPTGLLEFAGRPDSRACAVGTPERVVDRLSEFVADNELDELIVTTYTHDPQARLRSFELLAQAWGTGPDAA